MGFNRAHIKRNSQDKRCCYCKREMLANSFNHDPSADVRGQCISIEHIIPRSQGGTNDPYNLELACQRCNSMRGSLDHDIFTMFAQVILTAYPDAPNVYLRAALQQFITSLAQIAIRNKKESRQAISLALLGLGEMLRRNR